MAGTRQKSLDEGGHLGPRAGAWPGAALLEAAIGPFEQGEWLGGLGTGARLSVRVHIPFCDRICWFCAYRTQLARSEAELETYLRAVEREARLVADRLPTGARIAHLRIGGGTPTMLAPARLDALVCGIFRAIPPTGDAEVAIEVDALRFGPAMADCLAGIGVRRAVLGLPDATRRVSRVIGRPQGPGETRRAADLLRGAGVEMLEIETILGLPGQTDASLGRTLELALSLAPDTVHLAEFVHVPEAARRQRWLAEGPETEPGALDMRRSMAEARLAGAGLAPSGADRFARRPEAAGPAAVIGLGAAAVSRLPGGAVQNAAATARYVEAITAGGLAGARGRRMDAEDRLSAALVRRLLDGLTLDPAAAAAEAGATERAASARIAVLATAWPDALEPGAGGALRVRPHAARHARAMASRLACRPRR